MTWVTPPNFAAGTVVTESDLDTLSGDLQHLYDNLLANRTHGYWIDAVLFRPVVGSPTLTDEVTTDSSHGWALDGTVEEDLLTQLVMPHDYVSGTAVTFNLYWTNATTSSGDVAWQLYAKSHANGATLGTAGASNNTYTTSAPQSSALKITAHNLSFTPTEQSALTYLNVIRRADLAGDTLNGVDVYLLGVLMTYTARTTT